MTDAVISAAPRAASSRATTRPGVSLLAEGWAFEILQLLAEEPLNAEALERRLPPQTAPSARRALRRLARQDLLLRLPPIERPPSPRYAPTKAGFELLDAMQALQAWRACVPADADHAGMRALVTRPEPRLVLRALVEGELPFSEIQRRVPGLTPGTLNRVLISLRQQGIVREHPHPRRKHDLYALDEPAKRLAPVAVRSALWLWRWAPQSASIEASDLPGLLHLVAPLVSAPKEIDGVCQLIAEPPSPLNGHQRLSVWVRIAGGRVCALALPPVAHAQARLHAAPQAWCEALLHSDVTGVAVEGDRPIADSLLVGISETVTYDGRPNG